MKDQDIAKYSSKIYRKLYLYALVIMSASIGLTITFTSVFFRFDERRMFNGRSVNDALTIRNTLSKLVKYDRNNFVANKKIVISERPEQIVEFIYDINLLKNRKDISQRSVSRLLQTKRPQVVTDDNTKSSSVLLYLDEKNPSAGIISVELPRGKRRPPGGGPGDGGPPPHGPFGKPDMPTITGLSILIFLALLLIPYSRYLFRPFSNLLSSMNRVSKGDFKTLVNVSPKSDFKVIADSFNNMTMKIHEMIQQRDRLVADVSHELRTPLTRMRLALELLDKEGKGKKRYIDKSISEIEHLDKLIDDLLDASKLELNKNDFLFERLSVKKLLNDNIEKNNLIFKDNNLKIELDFCDRDVYSKIESQLFERALSNIFSNIAKYAPYGSKVSISLAVENKEATILIRDRGEGVKGDDYQKIFDPFYRTDASRSRKTGGTGLGLSIVKQIIKLHDGDINAEAPNDNEGGLCIKIKLRVVD